mmetsp:Transcript_119850/g.187991  ORF Transcript_119850/g.187991 Transcript_119850/m.187991 type:complete len:730 (+) Transcript_119850:41-2230(+)
MCTSIDVSFDAFVVFADAIVGSNASRDLLLGIWEEHGHHMENAIAQLTEYRLRRGFRPGSALRSSCSRDSDDSQNRTSDGGGSSIVADGNLSQETILTPTASENIQVIARFRPMSDQEVESQGERECVEFGDDGKTCVIAMEQPKTEVEFEFSRVFQPLASQEDIYEALSPTIMSVMSGINSSILAYGQTGSGKTHTMMGPNGAKAIIDGHFDDPDLGIIPRAMLELQDYANRSDGAVGLRVSYIEIYQEKVRDLLKVVKSYDGSKGKQIQTINDDGDKGIYLADVVEMPVLCARDAMEIMQKGNRYRTKSCTQMNSDSSRSHAIFIVSVSNDADPANRKFAQLFLVDLAGSERADKTGVWGKQLDEAKLINKSLLALGQVIVSLSEKASHVPYRDSKLTRLLQNVLGGNSRTALICAASPHPDNANESVSTLRFGSRASRIRNEARMNIVLDAKELKKSLDKARADIEELRRENALLRQEMQDSSVQAPTSCMITCDPHPYMLSDAAKRTMIPARTADTSPALVRPVAWANSDVCDTLVQKSSQEIPELIRTQIFIRRLLPALICPLTRAVMRDPVCASDGSTYERVAMERHMRHAGRMPAKSPVSGKALPSKQLVPNMAVAQLISINLPDLPPLESRLSDFARISIYLIDHILSFCPGKALVQSQRVCKQFYAVGSDTALWTALVRLEFGVSSGFVDPQKFYAERASKKVKLKPIPSPSQGLHLVIN